MKNPEVIWYVGIIVAFITAISTIISNVIKGQQEHRRELAKLAKEIALEDLYEARRIKQEDPEHEIRPTSSYVWFYFGFLKIIDKGSTNIKEIKDHLDNYGLLLDEYEKHKTHQMKKEA